ncbi:MAG: alanine racemase [Chloroflexi bacterium]|nr:alanine racemase [Chloroflexota bacterium]
MIALDDLIQATHAQLYGEEGPRIYNGFAYDSRLAQPGDLFCALVTSSGDGHAYIDEALQAGVRGVLCSRLPDQRPGGIAYVLVSDTQQALLEYSGYILRTRKIEVIAVTGSLGKTSTKEAAAAVLAQRYRVFKSVGNYNGRLGMAISLGSLDPSHTHAVLELASDSINEIRDLAAITRPRVGIVTQISPSHLELFGSLERIAQEKAALLHALPADGHAILNGDDAYIRSMARVSRAPLSWYGRTKDADLRLVDVQVSDAGTLVTVVEGDDEQVLSIPLLGAQHAYTVLAASLLGRLYGLGWKAIRAGLATVVPLPGHTRLLEGLNASRILDDSYNANPVSAASALQLLASLPARRRILLLGDMAELGAETLSAHQEVGRLAGSMVDQMVTHGEYSSLAGQAAVQNGLPPSELHVTATRQDAVRYLQATLQPGDLLLVKGSAEARMETITRELLAEPTRADDLLSRQNRGWQEIRLSRPERPTWVEIDLEAIAHNTRLLKQAVGTDVALLAVLKADAYGHGAIKTAHTVLNNGAKALGVACLGEAIVLRQAGVRAPLLVLGYTPAWQTHDAVLHDVPLTVFDLESAQALSRAALRLGRTASCHVKVDTGMGRLGLYPEEVSTFLAALADLPGLQVEGIFTHLATADESDPTYALEQLARFDNLLDNLRQTGRLPRIVHAANSAALLRFPHSRYDMVRPGIALYGINPSAQVPLPSGFRAALSFKSQIAQVKDLPVGASVSYGRRFIAERPTRVAVIPVGYADGFRRSPQNWGWVLVRGQRAPLIGSVCMDQTMLDVTEILGVAQGDEVVLIGKQGDEQITVDQAARQLGTISYELVAEILARVPRMS